MHPLAEGNYLSDEGTTLSAEGSHLPAKANSLPAEGTNCTADQQKAVGFCQKVVMTNEQCRRRYLAKIDSSIAPPHFLGSKIHFRYSSLDLPKKPSLYVKGSAATASAIIFLHAQQQISAFACTDLVIKNYDK